MPLVRIEVCDFKSYRGHQVIGPFKNFTSVIGPNGAGKSNLMDAISFVLGVKSAQLRSSQLKDLVYRGRRLGRSSQEGSSAIQEEDEDEGEGEGTAKKAWVLAVYEDADKKEWRFQRTISTSGSSEYKLNDKVVSYSAYNNALIKHNILVKAKNFLVFQGDVEAVAQQSPKDLSKLIDQISGSLELAPEYERAKEAQERATENATFNFTKRRGIAGEIKQYKEQKSEAERFESLRKERTALSTHANDIKTQNEALAGLRQEQRVHDRALEDARADQARARTDVMQKEKRIKKAEKALEAKRPELIQLEAQIAHSTRKRDNARKIAEQVERDAEKQREKLNSLTRDLEQVQGAANAAQEEQRRASRGDLSLSEESLEEYRRLKSQASVLAVDERQSLETLTRDEKTSSRALTQMKEKFEHFTNQKAKLQEDDAAQKLKRTELDEKVAQLETDLTKTRQELENLQSERTRIGLLEMQANEKLGKVQTELMQMNIDQRESERETKARETLQNLQRIFPGVKGRLRDLIKTTQRKYDTAIEVLMGRHHNSIVVDEFKTSEACVEYLRNQRLEQYTFLSLTTIKGEAINDKYRSFAKGSRLAVDVIQYDPAIEPAIQFAFGSSLVCDTIEIARYICYQKDQEVKAVTLNGQVIHKSGSMTGGSMSSRNGKKVTDRDVQELQQTRDKLISDLRELAQTKPRTSADEPLLAQIPRLESALSLARDDLTACRSRLNGIRDELRHIDSELRQLQPNLRRAQSAYDTLKERMEALATVIHEAEDDIYADFCQRIGVDNIRQYEERQLKVAQEESLARLQFETQIARLTHQSQFEQSQLNNTEERLATLQATVENEDRNLARHNQAKVVMEEELREAEESITTLREEYQASVAASDEKTKRVEQVKKTTARAARVLDQALKEIATKNDEIEKLGLDRSAIYRRCRLEEIKLPLIQGNLKQVPMEENLREEVAMDVDEDEEGTQRPKRVADFGIEVDFDSLDDDEREADSAEALADLDSSITKLSQELERMAPNMKAIERLDDVEAKLVETEREADKARKDSKTARDQFNEVRKRRCELFNKAYLHISNCIDPVYKELTKGMAAPLGGVAYLSLEDAEEPYTAGIKYHTMPPMKRFRDMEQLSGGEKTIAALALLFAIHSYQPSPFFVLDEVDAALDNTNVAKIANYIRAHSSDTFQFIVISLKGSLYERSNSLVGIYRDQEVNSSRTLTLDLTQYDE